MSQFRPPTEEQKKQLELRQAEKTKQQELELNQKLLATYQKHHDQWQIVLGNLFERMMLNNPHPTPEIRLGEDSRAKDEVLSVAATVLMRNQGPLQENRLNDPQYLHQLATLLIRTMVVNYHLAHDKANPALQDKQAAELKNFANEVQTLADKTINFQEKDVLNRFANFLKTNTPETLKEKDIQKDMRALMDEMNPDTLKQLQKPSMDFLKKTDALAEKFTKEMAPEAQKSLETETDKLLKVFKLPQPKPGGAGSRSKRGQGGEQADQEPKIGEDPDKYRGLLGLMSTNVAGSIPVTVSNNLGNGLGLLNSMRTESGISSANVDSWSEAKEMSAGVDEGLFTHDLAKKFYSENLKPALDKLESPQSSLPKHWSQEFEAKPK